MTDNVVQFPRINKRSLEPETLEMQAIKPTDVLEAALIEDLVSVVIIGTDSHGKPYLASSSGDPARIVWDIEMAKKYFLETFE